MKAYRVTVESTNALRNTTKATEGTVDGRTYVDCLDGEIVVVTENPQLIFGVFAVKRLEEIGPGYYLKEPPDAPA